MMAIQQQRQSHETEPNEDDRWRAVLTRNASFDGLFVYAVRSTGIYCRPTCPSRRPRREQVRFFSLPDAAERSGYRACRRCQPDMAMSPQANMVERACRWIEEHLDEAVTLAVLGQALGVSPHHMQRTFKRLIGVTPRQYAESCRLARVKQGLQSGEGVTSALYDAGYGSSSRLYERSSSQLGMTPNTYRRGGQGMHIRYTIVDCPLGRLLVGMTDRGISAVTIGDSDSDLEALLRSEFPNAEIIRGVDDNHGWVQQIVDQLEGRQPRVHLPVDVLATAFQRRVWEALRTIPYGGTRTYREIAREIGQPAASRAVARACATNPVTIVVPCHRVVREDGGVGGYRWGIERKQALLETEQATSAGAP